jgi:hypothetical protein
VIAVTPAVERFDAVGLPELQERAALLTRVERKYLVTTAQALALFARLEPTHRVLEIDGVRAFRNRTTYYDTPELLTLRDHLQRRRRRFKCRRRHYLDSEAAVLEVKYKDARGLTRKQAIACEPALPLADEELRFLRGGVEEATGRPVALERFAPTLTAEVRRVTLAAPSLGERVTCDLTVSLGTWELDGDLVIVESKSLSGRAVADGVLRSLGARERLCSKYCVGMALTDGRVRANDYRPVVRRFAAPSASFPPPDPTVRRG